MLIERKQYISQLFLCCQSCINIVVDVSTSFLCQYPVAVTNSCHSLVVTHLICTLLLCKYIHAAVSQSAALKAKQKTAKRTVDIESNDKLNSRTHFPAFANNIPTHTTPSRFARRVIQLQLINSSTASIVGKEATDYVDRCVIHSRINTVLNRSVMTAAMNLSSVLPVTLSNPLTLDSTVSLIRGSLALWYE